MQKIFGKKSAAFRSDDLTTYQPSSDVFDPIFGGTSVGGESATANAVATFSSALKNALYLQEPSASSVISPHDIYQAGLGDCYLLSAIGEIAIDDPAFIKNMIHTNANGTETVKLFEASNGAAIDVNTTSFKPTSVTVTNVFASNAVNAWTNADNVKNQQEIWPEVLEKAYAELNGGYAAIGNGGYDEVAMETLTGQTAQFEWSNTLNLASFESAIAHPNTMVQFDTPDQSNLAYGLVGDHSYMFDGLKTVSGHTMVALLNPWGVDEPALVPWTAVAHNFAGVTIGHV